MTTPRFFKAHGYTLHLVYFALSSLKDSEKRVERRVVLHLGHDVPKEVIKDNFYIGGKKMELYHQEFDHFILFNNRLTKTERFPRKVLEMEKDKLIYVDRTMPNWFDRVFPDLSKELKGDQF